jgi:mannose-6-phosphate isomerase-like protein (cupin superfamily)
LNEASAYSVKSPYEIYQEWEGIPVHKGFIVPDLLALELGDWQRSGGTAVFANQDGAGGMCDTVVEEISAGGQLKPQRHMFEKAVFILQGQGATPIWNEGAKKHSLEWQKGSLFSTPINTWHRHFNAGGEPARYLALKPRGFKFKK